MTPMVRLAAWLTGPIMLAMGAPAWAQPLSAGAPAPTSCLPAGPFAGPAPYRSVEPLSDGRVTFRLCAPDAHDVRVTSNDIDEAIPMGLAPGSARGLAMTIDASGLWSVTTAVPVPADTYRFTFQVEGVRVPDPQGTAFSHERVGTNSIFEVPGPEGQFQAYDPEIAHGVVSRIEYWSSSLGSLRQALVYTPPGYMSGGQLYPVLYLVHGAGDSADSWTSVGRAHYILDNLIAARQATPMIVVMPFGHTPDPAPATGNLLANSDFGSDLINDLIPYVDASFRTRAVRSHRAMAGLSMGGAHTLRFGLTHPELFSAIGVFSMGLGVQGPAEVTAFDQAHAPALAKAAEDLDLVYYAMGKDDFLYGSVAPTRALFEKYGIRHHYHETEGGHTWINWRRYLADFAPRLFRRRT